MDKNYGCIILCDVKTTDNLTVFKTKPNVSIKMFNN